MATELKEISVEVKAAELVIRIPRTKDAKGKVVMLPSKKTGKTLIVATTNGNKPTTAEVNGSVLTVGINAYIKNPDYQKP